MLIKGKILEMACDETLIVKIDTYNEGIEIVVPLELKHHFDSIPGNAVVTIEGDFEIKDSKIYFNSSLSFTVGKENIIQGFSKLRDLERGKYVNVLGIVVGWYEPRQSQGSDFVCTVDIVDETVNEKVRIRIFTKEKAFEEGFMPGDILEICSIKMVEPGLCLAGKRIKIRTLYSEYLKTEDANIDSSCISTLISHYMTIRNRFTRLKSIEELESNMFCDLVGQAIHVQIESADLVIVTIIDYTCNAKVQSGEDIMGHQNGMVVFVKAWETYARIAKELAAGDLILFKNMKINSIDDTITGYMSASRGGGITKLLSNHPLCKAFYVRKRRFEEKIETERRNIVSPPRFSHFDLSAISTLNGEGVYRVRGYIKYTIPLRPKTVYRCGSCNMARIVPFSGCCKSSEFFEEKICRILLCDMSGSTVVVCKNKVLESLFADCNQRFMRYNYFDSLLLRGSTSIGLINHMIDASFVI
eukprot:jgi/Antlo1/107/2018